MIDLAKVLSLVVTVTSDGGITIPPIITVVAPGTKFAPVSVIRIPPIVGPRLGVEPVTIGTAPLVYK